MKRYLIFFLILFSVIYFERHVITRKWAYIKTTYVTQHEKIEFLEKSTPIDRVFYILLERDAKRKALVEKEVKNKKLPFEIFSAIDGKKLTLKQIHSFEKNGIFTKKGIDRLKIGEIGCALSHRLLWERIAEDSKIQTALILEDDVQLDSQFLEIWERERFPKDFDIIFLYNKPKKTDLIATESPHIYRPVHPYCFHGFAISKKGAKKLLTTLFPITKPIDTELARLYLNQFDLFKKRDNLLMIYTLSPDLLTVQNLETNINI